MRLSQALAMKTNCPSSRPMLVRVPFAAPAKSSACRLERFISFTKSRKDASIPLASVPANGTSVQLGPV